MANLLIQRLVIQFELNKLFIYVLLKTNFLFSKLMTSTWWRMEIQVEEGPKEGERVHYVRKILATVNVKFLRVKSQFTRDTFSFPGIEDVTKVEKRQCKGILVTRST